MNKRIFLGLLAGFAGGSVAGNQFCKQNQLRLAKNKTTGKSTSVKRRHCVERIPKALSAAAKEPVDH